jgi:hypothetical protein
MHLIFPSSVHRSLKQLFLTHACSRNNGWPERMHAIHALQYCSDIAMFSIPFHMCSMFVLLAMSIGRRSSATAANVSRPCATPEVRHLSVVAEPGRQRDQRPGYTSPRDPPVPLFSSVCLLPAHSTCNATMNPRVSTS